jgi:hypothetical protein
MRERHMSEAEHLADALRGLFSNPRHGWFTPFSISTEGLSAVQASSVPADGFNSVWGVVNHVRFWQDSVRLHLQGATVDRSALGAEDGWPPVEDRQSEDAWGAARSAALESNEALAGCVADLNDASLGEPYHEGRALRSQLINGVIGHNCYHACEIITIRHMLGLWLART